MFSKIYIIAEIAQAHDGSLGILHSYIDAVSKIGANAVKFQMHYADAESSIYEPSRVNFSYVDKNRFEYWKRMELSFNQWKEIKDHCESVNLEFLVSPFSIKAVNILEKLKVKRYKIASGEINNYLMLQKISETKKPILISTGMSDFTEIKKTLEFLDSNNASNQRLLFQCTTSYPTPSNKVGLNVLDDLKTKFKIDVGLSDHSGKIFPSIAAVTFGIKAIEAHIVFDKKMFGPDAVSSLTINEFKQMVDGVRFIENCLKNPVDKNDLSDYVKIKEIFSKSLSANTNIKKGQVISFDDLETKKPASKGILSRDFKKVIGKKTNKDLKIGKFINWNDLDE